MVTAETAVVLPFVLAVALVLVWVASLGVAQVRLVDAAREAARMSARGDDDARVRAAARRLTEPRATVEVDTDSAVTTVVVRVAARPALPMFDHLPTVRLQARAVSAREAEDR